MSWWILIKDAAAVGEPQGRPAGCGACLLFDLLSWALDGHRHCDSRSGIRQEAVRGEVGLQLKGLLGDVSAQAVDAMLVGASKPQQELLRLS